MAVIITGCSGLIYAVGQQDLRQSADDPQIQMAEDAAAKLAGGQQVQSIVPTEKVDIAKSLAPYIIVFDATGKPIASSAQLDGQTPTIPPGVFDYVRQHGEDRITWQPQPGVRSAVVVTQFQGPNSGFVVAGRLAGLVCYSSACLQQSSSSESSDSQKKYVDDGKADTCYAPLVNSLSSMMYTTENSTSLLLHERMNKCMNRYTQRSLPLFITSIILGLLLLSLILFFGISTTTRGPIEIVLALLLGVLFLLFRALARRSK